jgi:uncharacterized membrane protein YdcZ (DUF606 family)
VVGSFVDGLAAIKERKETKTKQVSDGFSRWDFAGGFLGPFSLFPSLSCSSMSLGMVLDVQLRSIRAIAWRGVVPQV